MEENENFSKALLDLMSYLCLSNGHINEHERSLLIISSNALQIDYQIPEKLELLPQFEEIIKVIDTKEKKAVLLDYITHLIVADGVVENSEIELLEKIMTGIKIDEELKKDVVSFTNKLNVIESEWKTVKDRIV